MTVFDEIMALFGQLSVPARANEPMSAHTTFRIGGPARVFCTPNSQAQLAQAIAACHELGLRYYLLGRGSNVLFADEGYEGVVIQVGSKLGEIQVDGPRVTAGAGALLAHVCLAAAEAGLAGLEFAYGIPGCVGGGVYMNAGAYGGEMKDVLESATFFDEQLREVTLSASDLHLGYRTSAFELMPWCILRASFLLTPGDSEEIRARMRDFAQRRVDKQPLDMPSAGSTFKRPKGAYAGALIDKCGLRGYAVGGAAISEKHCGFVVNKGGATCADVICLTDTVAKIVKEQTGYTLEREIRVVR